ncbi:MULTISPECIES: hypothetical protein [Streptomyces]|uniref:Uncharacterized protein n=2 Tax=Streptomyces TaxID=1883 RepID=A0ABV9IQE6_9ACTN
MPGDGPEAASPPILHRRPPAQPRRAAPEPTGPRGARRMHEDRHRADALLDLIATMVEDYGNW